MKILLLVLLLLGGAIFVASAPTPAAPPVRGGASNGGFVSEAEGPGDRRIYPPGEDPRIETPDKRAHRYADQRSFAQLEAMKSRAWDQMTEARLRGDRAGLTRWNDEYNASKAAMEIQQSRRRERDDLDARLRREASRR